jgi:hypothetical protein
MMANEDELKRALERCEKTDMEQGDKEVVRSVVQFFLSLKKAHDADDIEAAEKLLQSLDEKKDE